MPNVESSEPRDASHATDEPSANDDTDLLGRGSKYSNAYAECREATSEKYEISLIWSEIDLIPVSELGGGLLNFGSTPMDGYEWECFWSPTTDPFVMAVPLWDDKKLPGLDNHVETREELADGLQRWFESQASTPAA